MNRRESKVTNAVSKEKTTKIIREINATVNDLTLDGLDFLVSEERYETHHIVGVAKSLFKKHGFCFGENFSVVVSITQLEIVLGQLKPAEASHCPLFIIFSTSVAQCLTICVTHSKNGVVVLYKNSLGSDIPKEIRETIMKCFVGATVKINRNREQDDENSSGPLALRNMEMIMEKFLHDKDMLIADFKTILFCSKNELKSVKDEFKKNVGRDIVETCIDLAKEIAKNSEFKQAATQLVDSCVDCIDLLKEIEQYGKKLRAEGEKQEDSIDYNAIKEMKEKLMNHPQVRQWSDLAKTADKDRKSFNQTFDNEMNQRALYKTELEEKYPEELQKFTKVFKLLGAEKKLNSERDEALQKVCEILGIDLKNITKVNNSLVSVDPAVESLPVKESLEVVRPIGISEIDYQTAALSSKQASNGDQKEKLVEQILAELATTQVKAEDTSKQTVKQARVFYKEKYRGNEEIEKLEENYRTIKRYHDQWKGVSIEAIQEWVRENKGAPNINLFDAIAAMDRANELVTGGHRLRDTQILAVLDFLGTVDGQGKLCQIETGEGKTVVVSLLAAFKVLQGKQVDVITSNEILAEEGVRNRKYFFGVLGISVAHNNPDESYKRGPRKCYTADVVYGSIGSFQFDYLKDSFEGFETRGKREFDFVILDEVDSLLLDNGGHIAKLAEPFPGFDSLKYVHIKIWQELIKAEKELVCEYREALNMTVDQLERKNGSSETEIQEENQNDVLTRKIKESDPANIDLIPIHLRKYARDMVDEWIKNAIYAKYLCNENEQYVVRRLRDDEEPKIVPVDNESTGMTLKNTMWTKGLHQFVQLKHNLNLTSETLTSSLISNIGYVKLYKHQIYGVTGTLGSKAEQKLLSKVYNVGYSKIPNFKPKIFEEIDGLVVKDTEFKTHIVQNTLKLIDDMRSVLIICSTISDVLGLEKKIKKAKLDILPVISTYFHEDGSDILEKEIGVGEIIISTNIAGRGADFKTSPDLEANGGLHVLVCFLPVNQRVEDQAFGRTSRQGNKGTAQIVVRESAASGFGQGLTFKEIKKRRDLLETSRLANVRDVDLAEIDFHDRIFSLFSHMYRQMLQDEQKHYLLKDLKEFWAFWLNRRQRDNDAILDVDEEFKKFMDEARHILGGQISHNPYYSIQQAEHFLQNGFLDRSEKSVKHAIELSGSYAELLYPAHIKMFEVSVEQGQAIMQRLKEIANDVLPFYCKFKAEAKHGYKEKSKESLELAKKGIEKELVYIQRNFTDVSCNIERTHGPDNQDFLNILAPDSENILVKHLCSKLTILRIYLAHIESILLQIVKGKNNETSIALRAKNADFWKSNNLSPEQAELRQRIGDDELKDLALRGLGTMYAIQMIVPSELDIGLFQPGLAQIVIGAAAFTTGLIFPPSMPIMIKIAEVFVFEGVVDIVVAIATLGDARFDIKSKLKSYGMMVFSIGIVSLVRYTQIAQRIVRACQSVITFLENCPNLKEVCKFVVPVLRETIRLLEKEISAQRAVSISCKPFGIKTVKTAASRFIKNLLCENNIDNIMESSLPQLMDHTAKIVKRKINRELFGSVSKEMVLHELTQVLDSSPNDVLKDVVSILGEHFNSWVKSSDFPEAARLKSASYTEEICKALEERLRDLPQGDGEFCNSGEYVDEVYGAVGTMIAQHVNGQMKKQFKKNVARAEYFATSGKGILSFYEFVLHYRSLPYP